MGTDREIPGTTSSGDEKNQALALLLLSLKTLSQKTLVAFASLFTAGTVFSAWWLFNADLPADPSTHQLVALGLYGGFILAVHWVKKR